MSNVKISRFRDFWIQVSIIGCHKSMTNVIIYIYTISSRRLLPMFYNTSIVDEESQRLQSREQKGQTFYGILVQVPSSIVTYLRFQYSFMSLKLEKHKRQRRWKKIYDQMKNWLSSDFLFSFFDRLGHLISLLIWKFTR